MSEIGHPTLTKRQTCDSVRGMMTLTYSQCEYLEAATRAGVAAGVGLIPAGRVHVMVQDAEGFILVRTDGEDDPGVWVDLDGQERK